MTTMKEIAKLVGVSTATVSRTLSFPDKVSLKTRNSIEYMLRKTGYPVPHQLVRSPRRQTTSTIVVLVPNSGALLFTDTIQGIEETAANAGYFIVLHYCRTQSIQKPEGIQHLLTQQADGILLLGTSIPFYDSQLKQKQWPPLVMVNEYKPQLALPTIHSDLLSAAFKAVSYLIQLGHQRIASISGPFDAFFSQHRTQGYLQALKRCGLLPEARYMINSPLSLAGGTRSLTTLMNQSNPPTAVFCHHDLLALGALHKAHQLGFNVPNELSIIGCEDIALAQYSEPPLTTIAQPCYEIGRQATLLLLDLLKGKATTVSSHLLNSELVIRASTAPPRQMCQGPVELSRTELPA